jgi:hypothetical protein
MSAIAARVDQILIPIVSLVLGTADCARAQARSSDLELLSKIVAVAAMDSRRATGDFEAGLSIDTASFIQLGKTAFGNEIPASDFLRALDRKARPTTYAKAIDCKSENPASCSIAGGGIFVRLDSLSISDSAAIAVVTVVTGRVAPSGVESVCPRGVKLLFRRRADGWAYQRRMAVAMC